MKELTQQEISQVSGAGFIQDALGNTGAFVGEQVYGLVSSIGFDLPGVGNVSLGSVLPDLGKDIGSTVGNLVGGTIEAGIASIPFFGFFLNKLLGN